MEPITREEKLMAGEQLEPITRKEYFLAKAAGMDVETPEPITREEMFLSMISGGGTGGSGPVIEALTVTENGTYNVPEGVDGYNPVTVEVASAGDIAVKMATGSVTFAEKAGVGTGCVIEHNLGVIPQGFFLIPSAVETSATYGLISELVTGIIYATAYYRKSNHTVETNIKTDGKGLEILNSANATETTIDILAPQGYRVASKIKPGETLYWFVWG